MAWKLVFTETASKQIDRLDKDIQRKLKLYLADACQLENPADRGHSLTGPWSGFHRYRVGQIRIIIRIERSIVTVTVVKVDRRDSVY